MQYVIFLSKVLQLFPQVNFLSIKSRIRGQKLLKVSICCVSTILPIPSGSWKSNLTAICIRRSKEICMFAFVNAKTVSRRLTINSQWLLPWGRGTRVKGGRKIYFTLYISHTFWRVIKLKNNTCNKNWSLETISAGALHQKNNDDDLASWLTYSAWQTKSLLDRWWAPWRQGTL